MKKQIIAFCGCAGSGKSVAAAHMVERHNFEEMAFATPVKSIAAIIGFPYKHLYGTQQQKLIIHPMWQISGRQFMQVFATQIMRNELPKHIPTMSHIWVNLMKYNLTQTRRNVAISDLRFLDEANMLKMMGAKLVRIDRTIPDTQNIFTRFVRKIIFIDIWGDEDERRKRVKSHQSEQEFMKINVDAIIDNNGTEEEFKEKIDKIISNPKFWNN
jgi:hypothetical protein